MKGNSRLMEGISILLPVAAFGVEATGELLAVRSRRVLGQRGEVLVV